MMELMDDFQRELWESLKIPCGSYNGEICLQVLDVLECISLPRPLFQSEIAEKLKLAPTHVELIQYILCNAGLAEYGTSPRGCWATEQGKMLSKRLEPYQTWLQMPEQD